MTAKVMIGDSIMTSIVISFIVSIMVVAIKSIIDRTFDKRNQKRDLFLKFYDEYFSLEFLEIRRRADSYLKSHKGMDFYNLAGYTHPEAINFSMVMHFFSRLSISYSHELIDRDLCRLYFKEHYMYWYNEYISKFKNDNSMKKEYQEIFELYEHFQ